jgi:hypothetical protein
VSLCRYTTQLSDSAQVARFGYRASDDTREEVLLVEEDASRRIYAIKEGKLAPTPLETAPKD